MRNRRRWGGLVPAAVLGLGLTTGCATLGGGVSEDEPTPGASAHPLSLGQAHVFDWSKGGEKLEVSPLQAKKGRIRDLAGYDLKADDKKKTPFYVNVRFRNAGKVPIESDDFGGGMHLELTDSAQRKLPALTLLDVFGGVKKPPCLSKRSPRNWPAGATMESCTIFLGEKDSPPASLVYSVAPMAGMVDPGHLIWWKIG